MNFIAHLKSKFQARKRSYAARVQNKAREKTVGKAEAQLYKAEARADDGVWRAQDRALGESSGRHAQNIAPAQDGRSHPQNAAPSAPAAAEAPVPIDRSAQNTELATRMVDLVELGLAEKRRAVKGWLVIQNGPDRGKDLRLYGGKNTLGNAANCDIVLTDPYVSARHTILNIDGENRVNLIDLDSRCGIYLNGRRTSREELVDNDTLKLGRTELKLYTLY